MNSFLLLVTSEYNFQDSLTEEASIMMLLAIVMGAMILAGGESKRDGNINSHT